MTHKIEKNKLLRICPDSCHPTAWTDGFEYILRFGINSYIKGTYKGLKDQVELNFSLEPRIKLSILFVRSVGRLYILDVDEVQTNTSGIDLEFDNLDKYDFRRDNPTYLTALNISAKKRDMQINQTTEFNPEDHLTFKANDPVANEHYSLNNQDVSIIELYSDNTKGIFYLEIAPSLFKITGLITKKTYTINLSE